MHGIVSKKCVSKKITLHGDDFTFKWGHQEKSWSRALAGGQFGIPNYCNYLWVAIYMVFLGEKLLPDPAAKDDALVIDASDGFAELKSLLGQYYQPHLNELKNLKKNISRFMESMKQWG